MEIGHLRGFNNSVKRRLSAPLRNGWKPLLKGALFVFEKGAAPQLPPQLRRWGAQLEKTRYLQGFFNRGVTKSDPLHSRRELRPLLL